ncbi:MAG: ATP-binding protein [Syntrophobacteraceae bacterium]|nr:ATP-binding protein [Syntrophobacteraceae bacterium]
MKILQLPASLGSLENFEEFVLQPAEDFGASSALLDDMKLVLEEVLVNIVSYGYPGSGGDIRVEWTFEENGEYRIQVRDWGVPFNPLEAPSPDLDTDFAGRDVGGLGILLVRRLAHEVGYERSGGCNVLNLTFLLRP